MKPITNILLVLALICYVFLPFYNIQFQGGLTGFQFTAGVISRTETLRGITFALIPFITGFVAVGLNCLKNRNWSYGVVPLILMGLWFFYTASDFQEFKLSHAPELTPGDDLGEGFSISGLGVGYISSCILTGLALLSCLISLLPFKFNEAIEKAVDDTIDKGIEGSRKRIEALGHEVRDEWNKIGSKAKKHDKQSQGDAAAHSVQDAPQEQAVVDVEDDSRFMPKQADNTAADGDKQPASDNDIPDDHMRFMPK